MSYQEINSETIDRWVRESWAWGRPVSHEEYERAVSGDWAIYLTPTKPVPRAWFEGVRGKRILGLASGGAQQIPILSALGAQCTVLDFSSKQCESERLVAEREGYDVRIIQGDMTQRLPFEDETFDLIVHPVSNCYVEEVEPIFRECHRVLRRGGILLCGLDIGTNYIFDDDQKTIAHSLPFNPLKDPALYAQSIANGDGIQFSHTLEEQIGGQLRAGMRLVDLYEDTNGEGNLHEHHIPSFIATKAVKP